MNVAGTQRMSFYLILIIVNVHTVLLYVKSYTKHRTWILLTTTPYFIDKEREITRASLTCLCIAGMEVAYGRDRLDQADWIQTALQLSQGGNLPWIRV